MGLLDNFLGSKDGRLGLALLAAGGPTTDPNKTGIGARLQSAIGSVDDWKQQQAQDKRAKMQEEFQQFQMDQARAQAMQQAQAQEQAQVDIGALRSTFSPISGGAAMANGQGPTLDNAENIGKVAPFDPRQFLANNPQASMGALKQAMDLNGAINPAPKREAYGPDQTVIEWTPQGPKEVLKTSGKPAAMPSSYQEWQLANENPLFSKFLSDRDEKKGVRVTVPVSMQGDSEYAKSQGKDYAEMMSGINKAAFSAPSQLRKLERMTQLLEGVEGGKLAPMGTEVASALNSFGIKIDPKIGNKEASVALSREIAGGFRQPGTGPMTDKDFENFLAQVPDLSKSAQGRKQITETMQRALARDIQVAKMAREYERKNGRIDGGFVDEVSQYVAENPVISLPQGYAVNRGGKR